jgi:hypothetical protein
MKRFVFFSSLAVLLSAGFAAQAQAQPPQYWWHYNGYNNNQQPYNAGGSNSYYNPQSNNWANQYFYNPVNTNSFPSMTSNAWSRQALRNGNSINNHSPNDPPTLYRPYYMINGFQSSIVPYSTPNYYAPATYNYRYR